MQQLNLIYEPRAPFIRDSETSKDAAESIKKDLSSMCRRVKDTVNDSIDGLTCEEVEQHTGLKHQTASARLKDLRDMGFVEWRQDKEGKDRKRKTTSGRWAKIYFSKLATSTSDT